MSEVFGRDPDALIRHRDLRLVGAQEARPHRERAASRHRTHGVVKQVEEDLLEKPVHT